MTKRKLLLSLLGIICCFNTNAQKNNEKAMLKGLQLVHANVLGDPSKWVEEVQPSEKSKVTYSKKGMDINVAKGATVWFKEKLQGEVVIQYDITVIDEGGENDQVRDMNCFWMFSDPAAKNGSLRFQENDRNGAFKNYHLLQGYYVGLGGYKNTKTRFRRYDGNVNRKLLPEHDLSDPKFLIEPNKQYTVTLVARGEKVQYYRDDVLIFDIKDDQPYTFGWFGFRTVNNHMKIEHFKIYMR